DIGAIEVPSRAVEVPLVAAVPEAGLRADVLGAGGAVVHERRASHVEAMRATLGCAREGVVAAGAEDIVVDDGTPHGCLGRAPERALQEALILQLRAEMLPHRLVAVLFVRLPVACVVVAIVGVVSVV